MKEPVETLLFDFGGTLDADGVAWKERFYAFNRHEGLDMTADAFEPSFFAADDPLVGGLAPATDLSGTVSALVTNLEAELARRGDDRRIHFDPQRAAHDAGSGRHPRSARPRL